MRMHQASAEEWTQSTPLLPLKHQLQSVPISDTWRI